MKRVARPAMAIFHTEKTFVTIWLSKNTCWADIFMLKALENEYLEADVSFLCPRITNAC